MPLRDNASHCNGPADGPADWSVPWWAILAIAAFAVCFVTDTVHDHNAGVVVRGPEVGPPQYGRVLVNPLLDTLVQAPLGPVRVSLGAVKCSVPNVTPYTFSPGSIVVVATICDLQKFYATTRAADPLAELRQKAKDEAQRFFTLQCPKMGIYDPLKADTEPWVAGITAQLAGVPGLCDAWVPTLHRPGNEGSVDETVQLATEVSAENELLKAEQEMTEKRAAILHANLTLTAKARAEAAAIDLEAETHAIRERGKAEAEALREVGAAEAEATKAKVAAVGTDPVIGPAALATEALGNANAVHVVSSGINVYPHAL